MYSFHDLPFPEEEGDIFEYIMSDRLSASAEEIALRALTMESLHEQFQSLSKRDILGRSFGVFGYPKRSPSETGSGKTAWKRRKSMRWKSCGNGV